MTVNDTTVRPACPQGEEYSQPMQVITTPFRFVGRLLLRIGRLITGRPQR